MSDRLGVQHQPAKRKNKPPYPFQAQSLVSHKFHHIMMLVDLSLCCEAKVREFTIFKHDL